LLVPIADGQARKLDLATWCGGPISVHPDGLRVAFTIEQVKGELWVLENFLSALSTKK
jgi:hypothetical protein